MYLIFTTPPLVHLSFFVTERVTYNAMALLLNGLFCLSSSVQLIFQWKIPLIEKPVFSVHLQFS